LRFCAFLREALGNHHTKNPSTKKKKKKKDDLQSDHSCTDGMNKGERKKEKRICEGSKRLNPFV
jgi:hypothetical protein